MATRKQLAIEKWAHNGTAVRAETQTLFTSELIEGAAFIGALERALDGERKAKGRLAKKCENQARLINQHDARVRELHEEHRAERTRLRAERDARQP